MMLHQAAARLAQQASSADGQAAAAVSSDQQPFPAQQQGQQGRQAALQPAAAAAAAGSCQQQAPQQPQRQVWACSACTFANRKTTFWCETCGASRRKRDTPSNSGGASHGSAAGEKGGRGATSSMFKGGGHSSGFGKGVSSKGGRGGGRGSSSGKGKGKRGRKPLAGRGGGAGPAAPSILRFVSTAPRQPSPPPDQVQQRQQQAAAGEQQAMPAHEQQQQQQVLLAEPADGEHSGCQLQEDLQPQLPDQQHLAAAHVPQGGAAGGGSSTHPVASSAHAAEHADGFADEDAAWSDEEGEEQGEPESPMLPGEDIMECNYCGDWIRATRIEAHEDEHIARQLQQQEEERLARLLGPASNTTPSTSQGGRGKKRPAGKPGGGRQVTLAAAFSKRPRQ